MKVSLDNGASFIQSVIEQNPDADAIQYGVLGMKWGVRKTRTGAVRARATMTRRNQKDAEWLNNRLMLGGSYAQAYNRTFRRAQFKIRRDIRAINRDPKYKSKDFRADSTLRKEYYAKISQAIESQLNASATVRGISPAGGLQMKFDFDVAKSIQPSVIVGIRDPRKVNREARNDSRKRIQHADEDTIEIVLPVIKNEMGYIVDIDFPEDEKLEHSDDDKAFIASVITQVKADATHYGVLGMKWGVRNAASRERLGNKPIRKAGDPAPTKHPKQPKQTLKTRQRNHAAAIKSMSNEDIQAMINRIELEQKLSRLTAPQKGPGRLAIENSLRNAGSQLLTKAVVGATTYAVTTAISKAGQPELAKALAGAQPKKKDEEKKK